MQGSTVMRQRGAETLVTEEPYALIAHVRICGGAGWVTTGSTRKPTPNSLRYAPAIERGSPLAFGVSIFPVSLHVAGHLISRYPCCMHVISRKTLRQFL